MSILGGYRTGVSSNGQPTPAYASTSVLPAALSDDGAEMWNYSSSDFSRSVDDGANWTLVRSFPLAVRVVRQLPAGGLLVALQGDATRPGEVWRCPDYNRASPTGGTWTKVLTFSADETYPDLWTMHVTTDVIVVGEYGAKTAGANGRYVYVSVDQGVTWRSIFSWVGNPNVDGLGLHVHGCAYDRWADRVWVVCGDDQHGIAYSDDWRNVAPTWTWISTTDQPVSVNPMASAVVFGMDDETNGVLIWDRSSATTRVAFRVRTDATLVTICNQTWWQSESDPLLLPFAMVPGQSGQGNLLATTDGKVFHRLWTDSTTYTGKGLLTILGPTASGKYVGTLWDDRNGATRVTFTAPTFSEAQR